MALRRSSTRLSGSPRDLLPVKVVGHSNACVEAAFAGGPP
jgi:hypothetical protein